MLVSRARVCANCRENTSHSSNDCDFCSDALVNRQTVLCDHPNARCEYRAEKMRFTSRIIVPEKSTKGISFILVFYSYSTALHLLQHLYYALFTLPTPRLTKSFPQVLNSTFLIFPLAVLGHSVSFVSSPMKNTHSGAD